ncbi:MAG TPA: enoyl-CoA hydratase/isomerase family protein [Usitatibacter sp.]|jgi:methylglutaconyl-CoA hydratase|nr:enoyl-CoA hydratase/isomerase family protein [Usitatibacter sp.]
MSEAIAVERQGPVGLLTMDRAERHNAFDDAIIAELTEALRSMEADEGVRVVVLSGAGKSFSAGADLNWMKRMAGFSVEENRRDAMGLATLLRTLAHLRKPTIARVHGAAYGGGVGLVACCDVAIATQKASFGLTEAKLGLIPAAISPYVVSAIGERAARRFFLTAERFDAAEAFRLGLVHDLAADEADLDEKIGAIVDAMLACSPAAQIAAKELIRAVADRPVTSELIQDTADRIAKIRASPEGREGVSAFLEKRRAAWVPPPAPEIAEDLPPEMPAE